MATRGWLTIAVLASILTLPAPSWGVVSGNCVLCHTMHNSEQGLPVAFVRNSSGEKVISEQPLENLLRTNCIGCHSHPGAETILENEQVRVPVVFNLTEPTYPPDGSNTSTLAGGNLHWLLGKGDAYGHNIGGIANEDLRLPPTQVPGSVARTGECTSCHGTLATAEASCKGCHVPHHHANGEGIVAGKTQGWYRFLGSVMQGDNLGEPPNEGVVGIEDPDWEQSPLENRHNVYQGKPGPYTGYLESGAISQKCVGCHGLFHSQTTGTGVWIRHPVEVAIPDRGEFAGYNAYNPLVPVARRDIGAEDAGFSQVDRGSDLVTCISCHRPHGSPYPAMLRWGYRDWPGDDSHTQQPAINGCAVCHTNKD